MKGEYTMGIFSIFKKKPKKETTSNEAKKPVHTKETQVNVPHNVNQGLGQQVVIEKPTTIEKQKPVSKPKGAVASKPTASKPAAAKPAVAKPSKYHVSQNKDPKSDSYKKWRVRIEGSQKTIKFFDTQKEAIAHAEDLAKSAGSSVVVHKLDGTIRKQNY